MGIRECVSLPLKPLQVHKPNYQSHKSAGRTPDRLQTGFDIVSMQLIRGNIKMAF